MWALGWPIAVSMFCRFAMFSMDSACVGHLNNKPLLDDSPLLKFPWAVANVEMPSLPAASVRVMELEDASEVGAAGEVYTPKEYLAASSLSDICLKTSLTTSCHYHLDSSLAFVYRCSTVTDMLSLRSFLFGAQAQQSARWHSWPCRAYPGA